MQGEPSIYHSLVLAGRNQGEVPAQHWEIPPPTSPGGCRVSVPNVVVQRRGSLSNAGALALVPALQELALVCIHHQLQCILIL